MHSGRVIAIATAVLFSLSSPAQQPQQSNPCIAADERIYKPGIDGVKPPQPQPDKDARNAPKIRDVSLQLVVNAEGHVCSVELIAARDKSSARDAANYIAQHWRFTPATKEGKPVAVTFTVNFAQ